MMAVLQNAIAYDFYAIAPSGQGLYYNINGITAIVANGTSTTGNLVIPDSVIYNETVYAVTQIGANAFSNCTELISVIIPNTVTHINRQAFLGCTNLSSITLGNSITNIGQNAFYNCRSLTSINIPNSVVSIEDAAFYYCENLTSINIEGPITSISDNVFRGCSRLAFIDIPNTVTSIGLNSFNLCSSLTSVTIPNSVTSIGLYAFANCYRLHSIIIGTSVTSISMDAFQNCSNLSTVIFNAIHCNYTPRNTYSSGTDQVFSGCNILSSFIFGETVNYIPGGILNGLTSLQEIISCASEAPTINNSSIFNDINSNINVRIPCNSLSSYNSEWGYFSNYIEGYIFNVTSKDTNWGIINVVSEPSCQVPSAEFNALAKTGYAFDHWSDGNTDNPRTITVTSDTAIIAYFSLIDNTPDTVHIHDTIYINGNPNFSIHSDGSDIVVEGAIGFTITLLDASRNMLDTQCALNDTPIRFESLTSGIYYVKVGNIPIRMRLNVN